MLGKEPQMEVKKGREWTAEQLSAIVNRDKTLLVSAAAGSGKTATLTERIIRSLTDKERPMDISSLLIVTFTKSATRELRAKITKALEEAVRSDPGNKELERQLYLLPSAKIRTIDGFCNDILKSNTDILGISPSYRLLDAAEEELLAKNILDGMIDAVYAGEIPEISSPEEFERLTDCLSDSKKSDEVSDIFRLVYSMLESEVEGVKALLPLIEKLDPGAFTSVEDSQLGKILLGAVREYAEHYISEYEKYRRIFSSGDDGEKKYLKAVEADLEIFKVLIRGEYSIICELLFTKKLFITLPSVSENDRTVDMTDFRKLRDDAKAELKAFEKYFYYREEDWHTLYEKIYPLLLVFYRFLIHFDGVFFEEKRRKSSFSYSDIERLAYSCLVREGELTEIADSARRQFAAIYIDEYQDVNPLQDSIFKAISRPDNRFMVGDIKQSIYGFRKAKPEIFARMKSDFPPLCEAQGSEAAIFMSKNFRSDSAIIDFVNSIFDKLFTLTGRSIGYENGDRLVTGKSCEGIEYKYPEICLIDKDDPYFSDEPTVVALKIKQLLDYGRKNDGTKILPGDIAILLRSASGKDTLYAEALAELGIGSEVAAKDDFFLTPEILLTLSVLNSIDNPRRDIYLAGYMCSPLAGFSADDLYMIRRESDCTCLYESLVSYTSSHEEFTKGREFLRQLDYYRTVAEGIGVDDLLYKIYHETGLLSLASKNGRKDNLTLLYDYARGYEAGSFKGLYNFIHFVNNLSAKRKTEFDDKRDSSETDAVKIMTCHSSKGLEYPVVFLADCDYAITDKDAKKRVVYSDELGLAFRLRTPSGLLPVNNPVREIINMHKFGKIYEEELRVLYVALTRPREQLYIIGESPLGALKGSSLSGAERYLEKCQKNRESLDEYSARRLSSFLEIILTCCDLSLTFSDTERPFDPRDLLGETGREYARRLDELRIREQQTECQPAEQSEEEKKTEQQADDLMPGGEKNAYGDEKIEIESSLLSELVRRFKFVYPNEYLTTLPEKMSVSKTTPTVLDGSDDRDILLFDAADDGAAEQKRTLPRFAESRPAEESAKRGIATHYLLQFCDLENLKNNGAEAELLRLIEGGFISREDAQRVRLNEIEKFRGSRLFEKMLNAKSIYREFRFTASLPAASLTGEEDRIAAYGKRGVLVQGVIDCLIENPDGSLSLYDYKTDRLTREELADKELAAATLKAKHSTQLSYYAAAVEEIFGRAPGEVEVYSLHLGDTVDVSCDQENSKTALNTVK